MIGEDENQTPRERAAEEESSSALKSWVAPLAVVSAAVIFLGMLLAYVDLTLGAVVALIGLVGVIVVGREAARSVE